MHLNNISIDYPIQILSKEEYEHLLNRAKLGDINDMEIEKRAAELFKKYMEDNPKPVEVYLTDSYYSNDIKTLKLYSTCTTERYPLSGIEKYNNQLRDDVLKHINQIAEPFMEDVKLNWHLRTNRLQKTCLMWKALSFLFLSLSVILSLIILFS